MPRIIHERPLRGEGVLEPIEEGVERLGKVSDLIVAGHGDPLSEIGFRDRPSGLLYRLNRFDDPSRENEREDRAAHDRGEADQHCRA